MNLPKIKKAKEVKAKDKGTPIKDKKVKISGAKLPKIDKKPKSPNEDSKMQHSFMSKTHLSERQKAVDEINAYNYELEEEQKMNEMNEKLNDDLDIYFKRNKDTYKDKLDSDMDNYKNNLNDQ